MDLLFALFLTIHACVGSGGLPDAACTPGTIDRHVTQETIATTICVPGYSKTVRPPTSVTSIIKRERMKVYGIAADDPSLYELDHLISLELGGAPRDASNLWPEAWDGPLGAHAKDKIENRLHAMVCDGEMSLADAQHAIATDWVGAYHEYIGGA